MAAPITAMRATTTGSASTQRARPRDQAGWFRGHLGRAPRTCPRSEDPPFAVWGADGSLPMHSVRVPVSAPPRSGGPPWRSSVPWPCFSPAPLTRSPRPLRRRRSRTRVRADLHRSGRHAPPARHRHRRPRRQWQLRQPGRLRRAAVGDAVGHAGPDPVRQRRRQRRRWHSGRFQRRRQRGPGRRGRRYWRWGIRCPHRRLGRPGQP